jgi:hypothetical protein
MPDSNSATWPRPVFAIPMERNIDQKAFFSFMRISRRGWSLFELPYSMRNDRARDMFSRATLESDFTHLIQLDSDHTHDEMIVERFMQRVIEDPNRLVIGGLNYKRCEPFSPCVFLPGEGGGTYTLTDWPRGIFKVANDSGPGWVGSGTICIAREVFERIPPPWWAFSYDAYSEGSWPGVDIYFCNKCHDYGIDLWIDTTLTSPHLLTVAAAKETWDGYCKSKVADGGPGDLPISDEDLELIGVPEEENVSGQT